MTRAAKIAYFAALFLGLSGGAFAGFKSSMSRLKSIEELRELRAPQTLVDFAFVQFRHADAEKAMQALQTCARFLQEMNARKSDQTLKLQLAQAYTRMALLEDRAHNPDRSHAYMEQARSWYISTGGRDRSETEMKSLLQKFDQSLFQQ